MRLTDYLGLSRVVAYSPDVARAVGSVNAALLLAQLWYLARGADAWMPVTREDIADATALSRHEQSGAQRTLSALGLIEVRMAGMPRRREVRLCVERLDTFHIGPTGRPKSDQLDDRKVADRTTEIRSSYRKDQLGEKEREKDGSAESSMMPPAPDPDPVEPLDADIALPDDHGPLTELIAVQYPGVGGTGRRSVRTANMLRFLSTMRAAYPGVDLLAETRKALAWEVANQTKAKTPKGHARFLRNWYERAQNGGRR